MDMNNTFVVANPHKCIACKACEVACAVAHLQTSVVIAGAVATPFLPRLNLIQTPLVTMPVQCRQCEDAPCANSCPADAITQKDNKIIVKTELCIGCKTCMFACPFGAMDMVPEYKDGQIVKQAGLQVSAKDQKTVAANKENFIAHKCDLCAGREGGPACVEACPASAFVVVNPLELKKSLKSRRAAAAAEATGFKKASST